MHIYIYVLYADYSVLMTKTMAELYKIFQRKGLKVYLVKIKVMVSKICRSLMYLPARNYHVTFAAEA